MLHFYANLKLLHKLALPMAVLLAVIGAIVWSAATGLSTLASNTDRVVSVVAARRDAALDIGIQINQANVDAKNAILDPGADAIRGYADDFKKVLDTTVADADKILALADTADWRSNAEQLQSAARAYAGIGQRSIDLAAAGDIAGATKLSLGDVRTARKTISTIANQGIDAASREMSEAQSASHALAQSILQSLLVTVAIGVTLALGLLGTIVIFLVARPLAKSTATMERLAHDDLTVSVVGAERKDEIGTLARSLQVFKDNAIEAKRMAAEQEALKTRAAAEQRAALLELADLFEASVGGIVHIVASASTEMQSAAEALSGTAEETNRQAAAVAAAATQSSDNVRSVAAATEELTASIGEIARQVTQSTQVAVTAEEEARHANDNVESLALAAQKIGEVIGLIQSIASQTNLLALNATIEAARAGDQGKGFAVVASEVKALATQTARATDDIAVQIAAIQAATGTAVSAIQQISGTIAKVSHISTTIASAVEEQGAATKDISANVSQVATGTNEVSSNIAVVTQAAGEVGAASSQMLGAASELSRQSERLQLEVGAFLAKVRAA